MRTLFSAIFVSFLMSFIFGCDTTLNGSGGQAGIYDLQHWPQADTLAEDSPFCSDRVYFSFSDNNNYERYYWIGMYKGGDLIGYSKVFRLTPPFEDSVIYIDVNYTFDLEFDIFWDYDFVVFACLNSHYMGIPDSSIDMSLSCTVNLFNILYSNCHSECCTMINNRYRAYFIKNIGNIAGSSAKIKTSYGRLCGHNYSSLPAQSNVYVGIQDSTFSSYLQIGYMIKRGFEGYPLEIDTFVYCECKGIFSEDEYLFIQFEHHDIIDPQYVPLPEPSSNHNYECIVDIDVGNVIFNYDGLEKPAISAPFWINRPMPMAIWAAEILGLESDMAGSVIDPCYITECYYRNTALDLYPAFYDSSTDKIGVTPIYYNDFDEWGIVADNIQNAIVIWDNNRLE